MLGTCCSVAKSCLTLWPDGLQHPRLLCPSLSPGVCLSSCPLPWWCHPTLSSSVALFSFCLLSFPASVSSPMSQLFTSSGQSVGASASPSVLLVCIQGWLPLRLTCLISLQSKGLSRVFSSIKFESITFFGILPYLWSNSHLHVSWKDHSFDYVDLCWQSDVFAF